MDIMKRINNCGLVPVIKLDDPDDALPLCRALLAGGIDIAEITFRSDAAAESIRRVASELPEMLTGAGTVHNVQQAEAAIRAGARFIVSPGLNPEVVRYSQQAGVAVIPGTSSPSDLETALGLGLDVVKFFPAEVLGGLAAIKAMAAAYGELRFMPTGGINENNLAEYMRDPKIVACGGSWMVPGTLVSAGDWDAITALTRRAVMTMHGFKLVHIGINTESPDEADQAARRFSSLFGWEYRPGVSSNFAGSDIEVMKQPYLGRHGHIAIGCHNAERARVYFEKAGFSFQEDTEKWADGQLKTIYFSDEIAGFAIHLIRI